MLPSCCAASFSAMLVMEEISLFPEKVNIEEELAGQSQLLSAS